MDKDKEIARLKKELEDAKLRLESAKLSQTIVELEKENNKLLKLNGLEVPKKGFLDIIQQPNDKPIREEDLIQEEVTLLANIKAMKEKIEVLIIEKGFK